METNAYAIQVQKQLSPKNWKTEKNLGLYFFKFKMKMLQCSGYLGFMFGSLTNSDAETPEIKCFRYFWMYVVT